MRSDMEGMPERMQTPENIIDCFLDHGGEGERIVACLAEFDLVVIKANLLAAKDAEIAALRSAVERFVYETTHLSPMEYDGSHKCTISSNALNQGRAALEMSGGVK